MSARVASSRLEGFLKRTAVGKRRADNFPAKTQDDRRLVVELASFAWTSANKVQNTDFQTTTTTSRKSERTTSNAKQNTTLSNQSQKLKAMRGSTLPKFKFRDSSRSTSVASEPELGFKLGPVSLTLADGDLVAVCGPVGSGKTTLVESLLGETIVTDGCVAYDPV